MPEKKETQFPPQHQERPGIESKMTPEPKDELQEYHGGDRLHGKVALITGADSGIGRAVAIAYAKEGADVAFVYLNEHDDARETKARVEGKGSRCLMIAGDVGDEAFCSEVIDRTIEEFGRLDILVNHAGEEHSQPSIEDISAAQLERTFRTNIFAFFYLTKAALPHLKEGSAIINTASVTAYKGNPHLIDYSSTKGAIVSFTRSLALSLAGRGIRVNGVAPGPIWTPLVISDFPAEAIPQFGIDTPMKRAGQPYEVAPCYVFLASVDSSYMTGQILHPNGGDIVNG